MNKLAATTVAALLVAVAGASTSAYAQDPKPEDYGVFLAPQTVSVQSREAVRAELRRERAAEVRADNKPEDYGVFVEPVNAAASRFAVKRAADLRAEYNPADYGVFLDTPAKPAREQLARAR